LPDIHHVYINSFFFKDNRNPGALQKSKDFNHYFNFSDKFPPLLLISSGTVLLLSDPV